MSEATPVTTAEMVVPNDTVQKLRAQFERAKDKAQPFPDGTVIAFTSVAGNGQHYHYSAVFTAGHWWFTGQGNSYFPKSIPHDKFADLMIQNGHTILDLRVATAFESIEL